MSVPITLEETWAQMISYVGGATPTDSTLRSLMIAFAEAVAASSGGGGLTVTQGGPPQSGTFNNGAVAVDAIAGTLWIFQGPNGTVTTPGDGWWQPALQPDVRTWWQGNNPSGNGWLGYTESMPRFMGTATFTPVSGTLYLAQIEPPPLALIKHITFMLGSTPASGVTHGWFGVWDLNFNLVAATADTGSSGSWFSNDPKTLPIATIATGSATQYQIPNSGESAAPAFYLSFCMVASSMPTLVGSPVMLAAIDNIEQAITTADNNSGAGYTGPPGYPFSVHSEAFSQLLYARFS